MPPNVRTLDQITQELAPTVQGQINLIGKRREQLGVTANAQRSGLEAQKVQGFNTINNQMTGRGLSFSGITADEQANYLSTKYAPALAALEASVNERNIGLDEQEERLNADVRKQAIGIRENEQRDLNAWNLSQEQFRQQMERARFEADRADARTRMQISASRGGGGGGRGGNLDNTVFNMLSSRVGKDGKVSPSAWRQIAAFYANNGGKFSGPQGFANKFWGFVNSSGNNWKSYLGKSYSTYG